MVDVRVKTLEWSTGWGVDKAETPIGHYFMEARRDGAFDVRLENVWNTWASTSDAAKAAAQADYDRRILSALEATPPAPKVTEGEWREVQTAHLLKGRRRSPAYFPATGEVCEVSGPNCDNADGYTWGETTVLWQNEIFVLYGSEGFWPVLHKHEHVLFRPLTSAQEAGKP